jgi:hypothetical protein
VLKANPTRRAIITTHGFLGASGERGVHHCEDTQYMWDALVEPNPNVWFVLSGHVHFEFRRTDVANGHDVHQLLADYQTLANGGNGWLRIMKFVPADNKVYVETYSPWLDRYQEDANSRFALDYPMREFVELGRIDGAPSGSTASLAWSGLAAGTAYEWYVVVTDSRGRERQGPHWRFTTGSGAPSNTAPVAAGAVFATVAGEAVAITLNADDAEGTPLTYVVVQGPAHGALTGAAPRLTYSPAPGFAGADSFTFQAGDGQAFSNLASVSISVGPAAAAVVASDDFESGSLAGGSGWSEAWTAAGDASLSTARNPHSGTYHVRLRGAGGHVERVVDLSGAAGARLRFWAKVRDFEGADKAYVKVSPDGRSYAIVKIFSPAEDDDAHHFFDIDLAAFARSSRFHIAFDAEMSSAGDYFFVDDVEVVISSAPPGGATPGWSPNSRRTGPGWQSPWADLRR